MERLQQVLNGERPVLTVECLKRKWTNAQGFFQLLAAYPAGLVCLVRLEGDMVLGEILIHGGKSSIDFKDQRTLLFTVCFEPAQEPHGDAFEIIDCMGMGVQEVVMPARSPPLVEMTVPQGRQCFDGREICEDLLKSDRYCTFLSLRLNLDQDWAQMRSSCDLDSL